jgi:D-serine deaminase-like pyridoxal phosphate-dependent protein
MISRPTLIVDQTKAVANIRAIQERCERHSLSFRPHFKTHQSLTIGNWYKDLGVNKITVSSVVMADYFIKNGWKDVLIAFPYNPLEAQVINQLAEEATVGVLIESEDALDHLEENVANSVSYHIAIDCGYRRTGISYENAPLVKKLMYAPSHHQFAGWVTHAGHTYNAHSSKEITAIHDQALLNINELIDAIGEKPHISYGDTPSASTCENWENVDELRCGNMVYYDLTQAAIGSCSTADIAVAIACPVVSKHPERNELVVYGGGVHFSKDRLEQNGATIYGKAVQINAHGWEPIQGVELKSLSQEHGKVSAPSAFIDKTNIGDIIGFLPVHSCMAADLLVLQQTLSGQPIKKLQLK